MGKNTTGRKEFESIKTPNGSIDFHESVPSKITEFLTTLLADYPFLKESLNFEMFSFSKEEIEKRMKDPLSEKEKTFLYKPETRFLYCINKKGVLGNPNKTDIVVFKDPNSLDNNTESLENIEQKEIFSRALMYDFYSNHYSTKKKAWEAMKGNVTKNKTVLSIQNFSGVMSKLLALKPESFYLSANENNIAMQIFNEFPDFKKQFIQNAIEANESMNQ